MISGSHRIDRTVSSLQVLPVVQLVSVFQSMSFKVPELKFNNGKKVPIFGLGTWKSKPGEVTQAVKDAIDIGYRHIDGAAMYANEKEVGQAISEKIAEGVVKREELFITSKLWNNSHRPDLVEPALRASLSDLGLEYVDLYLIHFPVGFKDGDELYPTNPDGSRQFSDVDYVDTWEAMEAVCEKGLAKSIGVSNFNSEQIDRLLMSAKIPPVTNQVECHPYLAQLELSKFCRNKNILLTAYSSLGSPDRPWAKPEDPQLLEDPKLQTIAKKYKKTTAQILIRYQIDRGHIVIPKSVTKSRIVENFDVFDFELVPEEIEYINSFDCNGRLLVRADLSGHKYYPFNIPF